MITIKGLQLKAFDAEGKECHEYVVTSIVGSLYGVINEGTTEQEIVELRVVTNGLENKLKIAEEALEISVKELNQINASHGLLIDQRVFNYISEALKQIKGES